MPRRILKFFNTTGPCNPDDHYMLPPEDRVRGAQLHRYVRDKLYWMLHAPRQTGKTTFLQSWMRQLNTTGEVTACYVSVERTQGITDLAQGMPEICTAIRQWAEREKLPLPELKTGMPGSMLSSIMGDWAAKTAPGPLVVLFDEVDCLEGEMLVSFLRQLRDGFASRGIGKFPVSVALVGMRDLKDYLATAKDGRPVNPGSPFNIKEDSATLRNFSRENIAALFARRTAATGQQIEPAALDHVWERTRGQPWIVNSLFKRATMRVLDEEDFSPVTLAHIRTAEQQMILARETHLDALAVRMEDPRVRRIMEALLAGSTNEQAFDDDALRLCLDLGLVRQAPDRPAEIANPIYKEILARQMSQKTLNFIQPRESFAWKREHPDGALDMDALLREFQKFWRRHSEIWESKSDYTEAFPHLLLMAFLQRIVNGGGRIEREFAAGRGRLDLAVEYKGAWHIIEIKIIHDYETVELIREEGIEQTAAYRDKFAPPLPPPPPSFLPSLPAYLVIFDRRSAGKKTPWEQRLTWDANFQNTGITVVGC
ncbi:MAG: ATP-binding protein [Opitutaceae bacterium]|jgi:hypothetical protein|nr:ATP-binding protein [Opitutaceae bacterium]